MSIPRLRRYRLSFALAALLLAALLLAALAALPVTTAVASRADSGGAPWRAALSHAGGAEVSGSIRTVVHDGDDSAGRLDIRSARSRLNAASGEATRVEYVVRTYEAFRIPALHHRWRRLVLELDIDGQPGSERNLLITARNGRLTAELISNATRTVIERLRVRHPSPTVLRVSGSRAQLGARKLFWTADWHRRGDPACGVVDGWPLTCQDSVPNDGWLRLDRPAWP